MLKIYHKMWWSVKRQILWVDFELEIIFWNGLDIGTALVHNVCSCMSDDINKEGATMQTKQATNTKKPVRPTNCDYCGESFADQTNVLNESIGYVPQYRAWVHEDCYEDHHGR